MEQRIATRANDHSMQFKTDIKGWLEQYNIRAIRNNEEDVTAAFLQFVYDYKEVSFSADDFQKRKRTANAIPLHERCIAKRANSEQCSRRKKEGSCFCGTHAKGTPHGVSEGNAEELPAKSVEIWTEDIQGIHYYLDDQGNVYSPQDIVGEVKTPRVVGKWNRAEGGKIYIEEIHHDEPH